MSESFLDNYVLAVAIVFHQLLGYNTHMVVGMNWVNMGPKKVCPPKLRRYVHDVTVHVYQVWNCVESIEWTSYMAVFSGLQRCAFMMSLYEKESRSLINRTDCEQQLDAISGLDQL